MTKESNTKQKRIFRSAVLAAAVLMLAAVLFVGAGAATAVTGDGTEGSPYVITAADQWYSLANISYATKNFDTLGDDFAKFNLGSTKANQTILLAANYTLENSITLKNYNGDGVGKTWNNYYGVLAFAGNFDGMGYTIALDIDMQFVVSSDKQKKTGRCICNRERC